MVLLSWHVSILGWQLVAEQVPPKHLSQEPVLNISFLKLHLNPPVLHSPVSDQIWERWS